MNLASPAALLFAMLAIPIVVLYILKVRLRRVPVSTLIFWRQIFEEKKPRSIWQRLRHLLSLLLQLAFLALLVFALADPIVRSQQARARRLVLIVDNSASMNAVDVAPSRLAAARAEAHRVIDGLRLGDELALVAAGTQPQVYCGLTDHQRTLRRALDAIPPGDGPTEVGGAVALARRLVSATDKAHKIVVLTDGGFDGTAELVKQGDVEVVPVGKSTGNVGITRLQARRSLLDPVGYEILVEIRNASDEPAECRLELELEGDPIDVVPLKLAAGERSAQVFSKTSADGGRLRARLNRDDALMADNTAFAILPRRKPQPLTLVTEGNLFLEKVFEAIPLVDLAVAAEPPAPSATAGRVTVFHRKVPETLPPGPVLVIEPAGPNALWQVDEPLQNPVVAKQDRDSPLLAHVRLDQVLMPEARKLTIKGPAQVLVESATGDPLLAVIDRPEGKVVLLTVNLEKGDLPLQTAFPIMMTNWLGWLAGSRGELREALPTGAVTTVELPAGPPGIKAERLLRGPDGSERPLPADGPKVAVGPLERCGVWSIVRRASGPASKASEPKANADETLIELACNLSNGRESDLRPGPGMPARAAGIASGFGTRPIWFYLVAFAWLLTCWEWLLYQRRWID
jgi:von Willebrand factor type A domain/Aerotolerance regulator N-terminal